MTVDFNNIAEWARVEMAFGGLPELAGLSGVLQTPLHHPEGDALVHTLMCLEYADKLKSPARVKWAVLCHDLGKVVFHETGKCHGHEKAGVPIARALGERFGLSERDIKFSEVVTEYHTKMHMIENLTAGKTLDMIKTVLAVDESGSSFLEACICDVRGRGEPVCYEEYHQASLFGYLTHKYHHVHRGFHDMPRDMQAGQVAMWSFEASMKIKQWKDDGHEGTIPFWRLLSN